MLKVANLPHLPMPTGYSHAIEANATNRVLYIAGQVGRGLDGRIPPGIGDQTRNVIDNLHVLLTQANMTMKNVVKFTVFLTDEALLPEFTAIWYAALPDPPPAVTGVIAKALVHPSLLVEIEGIAVA